MRIAVLACAVLAGCAARTPDLPVPSPEPGSLRVRAVATARLGSIQPVIVAPANARDVPLRLDPRQVFALDEHGARVAPLTSAGAARRAGGGVPSALKGGALGGARDGNAGRVAEFQDPALAESTLANDFSATGYVYYPTAPYPSLDLFAVEDAGTVVRARVPGA